MQCTCVIILQSDLTIAQSMVMSLSTSFFSVRAVRTLDELRAGVVKHRPETAILDMEMVSFDDLQRLCREFPQVSIVCTHRLADDEMWTSALSAGAIDVCPPNDPKSILFAALKNARSLQSAAA